VPIHQQLAARFPEEPELLNQLAVTYMTVGRNKEAQQVLEKVLQRWPKNGFAMVSLIMC
jgi:Tfp pilus assembly protein PilF